MNPTKPSDTPIYDATLRETGCDVATIVNRPAWSPEWRRDSPGKTRAGDLGEARLRRSPRSRDRALEVSQDPGAAIA